MATVIAMRRYATSAAVSASTPKAVGLVFPGQGSQNVGMGKELNDTFSSAREVWERVDEALGEPLSKLAFSGDATELCLTRNAQPAILAASIAALRCSQTVAGFPIGNAADVSPRDPPAIVAACALGHSLGEYSALVASGAISLENAVRAVRYRGDVMQQASEGFCSTYCGESSSGDSEFIGMAALLKFQSARVNEFSVELICALESHPVEVCQVANINSDGQVVLSGTRAGVEIAIGIAKASYGARRAVWLPVSAPFHCPIMQPAANRLRTWFEEQGSHFWKSTKGGSGVPIVICNVSAGPMDLRNRQAMIESLTQQVTAPVRWSDSVRACVNSSGLGLGCAGFVEFGGSVLGSLISQTTTSSPHKVQTISVTSPADVEVLAQRLTDL
jgi:[acyl-carrier-protein] S-malonyltransferase